MAVTEPAETDRLPLHYPNRPHQGSVSGQHAVLDSVLEGKSAVLPAPTVWFCETDSSVPSEAIQWIEP